mmetsp:Transcript_4151/g.7941  ORF Transcript_4151/g.7941 Transcript_4151/m.7941 type:complete len:139 (-) Transcript_4151:444-860(-)
MVSLSRKRLLIECTNELDSALELSKNSRPCIETSTFKKDTIESLPELCNYISSISSQIPEAAVTAHDKLYKTNDLMNYVYNLIDLCKQFDIQYHHQSVVVLEPKPVDTESNSSSHFFDINKVIHILAIESRMTGDSCI